MLIIKPIKNIRRGIELLALTSLPMFLSLPSFAANLVADYQFQNSLSSTVVGATSLVDLGTTNTFSTATVGEETVSVFNFAQNTGLQLSTLNLIPSNKYSVVMLFEFDEVSSYRRILDFKNGTSDNGLYINDSTLKFYNNGLSGSGTPIAIEANTYVELVLTRNESAQLTTFINGVEQFSFSDIDSGDAIISSDISSDNILRFFRDDDVVGGENSSGSVARIRLYDDALSADAIQALERLPVPLPSSPSIVLPDEVEVLERFSAIPPSPSPSVPEPSSVVGLLTLSMLGFLKIVKKNNP